MSDFNLLKHRVQELEDTLESLALQMTKNRIVTGTVADDGKIYINCEALVLGSQLAIDVLLLDGNSVRVEIKIDGVQVITSESKMTSGEVLVKGRVMHNVAVTISGTSLTTARLRLDGAGLKVI